MRFPAARYHRHRFPAEIISHCVWLYLRFALSFRDRLVALRKHFNEVARKGNGVYDGWGTEVVK